jgi:hypothetical protein
LLRLSEAKATILTCFPAFACITKSLQPNIRKNNQGRWKYQMKGKKKGDTNIPNQTNKEHIAANEDKNEKKNKNRNN